MRRRLTAYAVAAGALLALLFAVYVGAPWLGRQRRPFERAWRALRGAPPGSAVQRQHALRQLHAALNQAAGEVLFAGGVERFVAAHPAYAPLRADLAAFFGHSQRAFFAAAPADDASLGPWLIAFSRRLRDTERGTA